MAAKTATRKPAKVVSREELAKDVVDLSTADAAGSILADSFVSELSSGDAYVFEQARIAFTSITMGAKPNDVAKATTAAILARDPERDPSITVSKGGASVTRPAIVQRADAWGMVLRAGIAEPTMETVVLAYRRFTSKGGVGRAESRDAFADEVRALAESEREAYFLANGKAVSVALDEKLKAERKGTSTAAETAADNKADTPVEPVELDTVADILAFVAATAARPWSDDDRATLAAAFTAAAEKLA